jgi:hypothetical protein
VIGRDVPVDPYDREYDEWLENSRPDSLEATWRKVHMLLGGDGTVAGVYRGRAPTEWVAICSGPRAFKLRGDGHTPALAMRELLDQLGGIRKFEELTKGPRR